MNEEKWQMTSLVKLLSFQCPGVSCIDGKWVKLSPGMSVTAGVKTGTRRLIEFFLSPLLRYKQESLGER